MSTCTYERWDGAYVLGSLSPAERREYERHLGTCDECSRAVRELAGVPGLLARVGSDVLEEPEEPVPATLLPALAAQVRRRRRRGRLVAAVVAAAAVTAIGVAVPLLADRGSPDVADAIATGATPVAMTTVGGAPVQGALAFESVRWGTRLDLTCSYARGRYDGGYEPAQETYRLVVHTRDGKVEQVGTWRGVDGATMHLTAATSAERDEITEVEVRRGDDTPVLRVSG